MVPHEPLGSIHVQIVVLGVKLRLLIRQSGHHWCRIVNHDIVFIWSQSDKRLRHRRLCGRHVISVKSWGHHNAHDGILNIRDMGNHVDDFLGWVQFSQLFGSGKAYIKWFQVIQMALAFEVGLVHKQDHVVRKLIPGFWKLQLCADFLQNTTRVFFLKFLFKEVLCVDHKEGWKLSFKIAAEYLIFKEGAILKRG